MSDFYLKYRDTRPVLEVYLLDPSGTAHDLTGATAATLHIRLSSGITSSKTMTIYSSTGGVLRYTWLAADWTSSSDALIAGNHRMEYEVIGPTTARLTWPNDGYDLLCVTDDFGQTT